MTGHWRKPLDYSATSPLEQARAQLEAFRNVFRSPSEPVGDWADFEAALEDDFNTPEALAVLHGWRDHELLRRAFGIFGLESIAEQEEAPAELVALAEQRVAAREAKDFAESDRLRGEIEAAGWSVRDVDGGFQLVTAVNRDLVYGRSPVREALRGRREVLELWAGENALKSEEWLREVEKPRVQTKLERDLSEAAGTRDHQGVVAWCEPFRYADAFELAAGEAPLLACLDQVSDPRNLGAVLRSAEGAGASGVVVTAHGSAHVTPAVCRASAGAVEHVPVAVVTNLARYLDGDQARRPLDRRAQSAIPERRCGRPTSPAASPSRSGRRGKGCGRSCGKPATSRSRSRSSGRSSRSTSASPRRSCCTRRGRQRDV